MRLHIVSVLQEGTNLLYIPIYFLLVPTMYLILMIFSLCNINCVSWGTREVKQALSPVSINCVSWGTRKVKQALSPVSMKQMIKEALLPVSTARVSV